MSIKIVVFGENDQVVKFLEKSRGGHSLQSEESIIVQNVTVADSHFLIFAVRQRGLVSQQATGTNGLLFFLGGQTPLFEEKQYLTDLLSSKLQFDGVPVAVLFEKGQQLSLKDVVNYMELYRLKDRASMIKQINWSETQWINEVYGWVKAQSDHTRTRGFQAAPKVVKLKAKYRESVEEESEKKYEGLVNDKQVRTLAVKQQQQLYIDRQKQKLKQENMDTQLANFSRNKKKMSPYDIKPTPNPKIEPNLHFFLKDPNSQPPPQVSIKIQTDQFKDRPAPPPYKPKKTGINTSTQIEQNQLFSFDKEVKPILAILTTKALQTAALEIEQQQELLKMAKYKSAYEERVRKQKDHQQKNIDQELRIIKEKDKLLEQHRLRAKTRENIQHRVQCYEIANKLLSNIYLESAKKLVTANAYPDSLTNFLSTDFIEEITDKAAIHYQKIVQAQTAIRGIFEKDVVGSIKTVASSIKQQRQKTKKKLEARLINKSSTTRKVHILYKHEHLQFSNFSKYMTKHFDNTFDDYVKTRQEQVQEAFDRLQGGQITEEQLLKIKLKDSIQYSASGHHCYLLKNQHQLCFTSTSNCYEKVKENYISNGFLLFDKEGQVAEKFTFGQVDPKLDYLRIQHNLRDIRESSNMDDGIIINLAKIPQKIKCLVLVSRITDVQRFRSDAEAKKIKYAAFGLQFWQHKIPIHSKNIGQTLKWEQIVKAQEGEEPPAQNLIVISYVLRRRVLPQFWTLEDVSFVPQPYKTKQQLQHLQDQIYRFYNRSNQNLKQEEDEQKIQRPPSSSQQRKGSPGARVKSKKLIEEPKKKIILKVATKILNEISIDLNEPFAQTFNKLKISIEQWKQFTQSCQNGWEILIKGKPLESVQQLRSFKKIGDLIVKKIPKIQEVKIQKIEENEGEKDGQQQ